MSLGLPVPDECRLLPSVSVDPSPADYQQLQELLQQALKREADALRKINHLHQQLMARDIAARSDCKFIDLPSSCTVAICRLFLRMQRDLRARTPPRRATGTSWITCIQS